MFHGELSAFCAQLLGNALGVPTAGNVIQLPLHTMSTSVFVETLQEEERGWGAGLRISCEIDGRAVPALTSGNVGFSSTRDRALVEAIGAWARGYGMPIVEVLTRRPPKGYAGPYDVYPGPTAVRGATLENLGALHERVFGVVTPAIYQLLPTFELHVLTLAVVSRPGMAVDGEFRVDGEVSELLASLGRSVAWPESNEGYMLKQAYILAPRKA